MSARAIVDRLGPTAAAQEACLALGESLRWMRRHRAYELFRQGLTVAQVREITGFSRTTVYRYFEQWRGCRREH